MYKETFFRLCPPLKRLLMAPLLTLCTGGFAVASPVIEHWTTPSGTSVYFVASRSLPMLDIRVDFAAGQAADPPDRSGLASLTHTLLDLGAGEHDEAVIARKFADLGAQLGGAVDLDRASLTLRSLSHPDKLPQAIALLRQILAAPHFAQATFERERTRALAELKDSLTRPDTLAQRAFWEGIYPGHPYGLQASAESLTAITLNQVRDFYRDYYTRQNAVITLVGDIDRGEAEKLSESLSAAMLPGLSPAQRPPEPPTLTGGTREIAHPASQNHILMGLPAIPRGHPDFFPLLVGNYTLGGGGFVSRLMQEVREKRGYAYSVYSYVQPLRVAGPFQIGLQTKASQATEALNLSLDTLREFVANGPSESELRAAKANLAGSFPLRLDSNRKLLDNVSTIGFYGLPLDWLAHYQARIRAVTRTQVRAAFARHVHPEKLHIVIVGQMP